MKCSKGSCNQIGLKAALQQHSRWDHNGYDYKYSADVDYIYFLSDPENCNGIIFFKCINERHKYSRKIIRGYLDPVKGWCEKVHRISTGTVTHLIVETNVTHTHIKRCDYRLAAIELIKIDQGDG